MLNPWVDDYRGSKAACSSDTGGNIQIWHLNRDVLHLLWSVRLLRWSDNALNTKQATRRLQLDKASVSATLLCYKSVNNKAFSIQSPRNTSRRKHLIADIQWASPDLRTLDLITYTPLQFGFSFCDFSRCVKTHLYFSYLFSVLFCFLFCF